MTVYAPKGRNFGVAVVVFPRRGYQVLAMDLEGREIGDWLTSRGITCMPLKAAAGFASVEFAEAHEPVFYGSSISAAYEAIVELFVARRAPAGELLQPLQAWLDAHPTPDGVLSDSCAWIVTACRV